MDALRDSEEAHTHVRRATRAVRFGRALPVRRIAASLLAAALVVGLALDRGLMVGHGAFAPLSLAAALAAGAGVVVAAWLAACALLVPLAKTREDAARVGTRAALAPLTASLAILFVALVDAEAWYFGGKVFARLVPLILLGLALFALLPAETRSALDGIARRRHAHWLALAAAALCVVAAIEIALVGLVLGDFAYHGTPFHLALNVALVSGLAAVLYAASGRLAFAIGLSALLCYAMATSSLLKLSMLQSPATLTDIAHLADLWMVQVPDRPLRAAATSLTGLALVLLAGALLWRDRRGSRPAAVRATTGAIGVLLLLGVSHGPFLEPTRAWFERADVRHHSYGDRGSSKRNGLLLEAALIGDRLFIPAPSGYSADSVRDGISRYTSAGGEEPAAAQGAGDASHVNLVVLVIEAFWDPVRAGVRFTRDPIPTYRRISNQFGRGRLISPVFGGYSANLDFELLTGFSVHNFPDPRAIAYSTYVRRELPAIPRQLAPHGYRSQVILSTRAGFHNARFAYDRMGFDSVESLLTDPTVARDAADRWPSDEALVDAVIEASRAGGPFFLHAISNATHWPWNYAAYDDSDLDVASPMPEDQRRPLKTYANALHAADAALAKLLAHFERFPEKTLILVAGDHLPLLARSTEAYASLFEGGLSALEARYGSPALLWANFERSPGDFVTSANLVAPWLLREMGIEPGGFLASLEQMRGRYPVLSHYVQRADGTKSTRERADGETRQVLRDYELLQYDLLFGARHQVASSHQ